MGIQIMECETIIFSGHKEVLIIETYQFAWQRMSVVVPAKAGPRVFNRDWIPAFAGMTA